MANTYKVQISGVVNGAPESFVVNVSLTETQLVALKHFLNRIAAGSITANQTAAIEKLSTLAAQGSITTQLAADLVALLNAQAAGTDISSVHTAIAAL